MQMICVALPSWRAMQSFIDVLHIESAKIDMLCNAEKSVAMIFNPRNRKIQFESSLSKLYGRILIATICLGI